MNEQETMQKKNRIITIMVVFGMLVFVIVNMVKNTYSGEIIFDAMQFYTGDFVTTVSEEQLINMQGQPDKTKTWNYINGAITYSINSLQYEPNSNSSSGYTYTYDFSSGALQRIVIEDLQLEYSSKYHILAMFGLIRSSDSFVNATDTTFKVTNCGVHDLQVTDMNKQILNNVQITYGTIYD